MASDRYSTANRTLAVEEEIPLLIVGAGPAGLAAALEATRLGLRVLLVDENPVPRELMGLDVPLQFGGRMGGAVRNRAAMTEAMLDSDPMIAAAFEAGVDVRLGVSVWGLFDNDRAVGWLPGLVAGLEEAGRCWMVRAECVIVAAGSRDMGLAFPGWDRPGVVGAMAVLRLLGRYGTGALDARDAVVLGSTAEGLAAARAMVASGIRVAAVIEQASRPVHDGPWPDGAELPPGHVIRRVEGHAEVEAVVLARVDAAGNALPGPERRIACDTVVLAVGAVPQVELLDAHGCAITFQPERGGQAPVLDGARTSRPRVFAAGDCAGMWPEKTLSRAVAEEEGRNAAAMAARSLGVPTASRPAPKPPAASFDLAAYRLAWVRASVAGSDGEPPVCQCEGVTARDILEVRPPRYLEAPADRRNDRSLLGLLGAAPPDPDQVKRLTRAGMGVCQGRRCREQVAALLALGSGAGLHEIRVATHRAPVRPLPLATLAMTSDCATSAGWDTWFGMPSQYLPPWKVPAAYTVATRPDEEPASE